jgi:adenylate cyclase
MEHSKFSQIAAWTVGAGLAGYSETVILTGFCDRATAMGLPLANALVIIDTLHPIYEGHACRWERGQKETSRVEYERTNEGERAEAWRTSPFYRLLESGKSFMRWRLTEEVDAEYPTLAKSRAEGMADFLCIINRFAPEGIIGEMDCVYSGWTTDQPGGFSDSDLAVLNGLLPFLALAMKSASLARQTKTLMETYLGRDAGRLVLEGRIARGVADQIDAALWFSDLRGYTKITDTSAPEQIIPMLNDYADSAISAIHQQGGDVLKLIGDGVLAIFRANDPQTACKQAITAAIEARKAIAALNQRRTTDGLPTTDMYLGLHLGQVFFGNIGSKDRLDFTIVGPAVNETSRIATMCRSVDQPLLVSARFAACLGDAGPGLASVGRFALRGVGASQDLFTIDAQRP